MKRFYLLIWFIFCGCQSIVIPDNFTYKEIQTDTYKLASWQKISNPKAPVRIYIEGDGHAFNHLGQPTTDPTPQGTFLRKIAFNDPNENVVYLGRACQYVKNTHCHQNDWTTGRFSKKILDSTIQAIQNISVGRPTVLIGYSGGALLSGLVINQNPNLNITKWVTVAGVLNHTKWTKDLKLPPLSDSMDLKKLPHITQLHLVGGKDEVVSYKLSESLANKKNLIIIPNATHDTGFDPYYNIIYQN